MYNEYNEQPSYSEIEKGQMLDRQVAVYLAKVMGWMCLGLLTTATACVLFLAGMTYSYTLVRLITTPGVIYGILIAQVVVALGMSGLVRKINSVVATVLFMLYSALTGVTFSVIMSMFSLVSILYVFGLTAFIFVALAVYGFVTKKDLTRIGTLAIFGLIGIILGSVVNIFMGSGPLDLVITAVGIVIFIILIAYDTQKIKGYYLSAVEQGMGDYDEPVRKMAIYGAFTLYLDFINLFLKLLRVLGRRK